MEAKIPVALIQHLRSLIDVPISEAKELLTMSGGDATVAYESALDRRIGPILEATGLPRSAIAEAFLKNGQDVVRTLKYLRYAANPVAFEKFQRPKVIELVSAIKEAFDVYSLLEACDIDGVEGTEELRGHPALIRDLECIRVFYSLYLTDTDALLRYHPQEFHDMIDHALREIGHAAMADCYQQDVLAVKQSNENFSAFLAEEEAFFENLRAFCLRHVDEVYTWRMSKIPRDNGKE